ncbi:MAG: hypothetical protein WAL36_09650 [Pseudolabrys sp.]
MRAFLSGAGPTAFLDMPWIPLFLIPLFLFHPAIGVVTTCGAATIVAMTLVTEWQARGAAKISTEGSAQRQVLSDALRQNADVIRALGMTGRLSRRNCELILTQQLDQTRVRTTAQLEGLVSYVSADLNHDRQKNPNAGPYYTVRVTRPPSERRRLGGLELVSGMPVEVFLQTGSRTMMS